MFVIDKEDKTIHITRGDIGFFEFWSKDRETGERHKFQAGDVVRFKVFGKKACDKVVISKDFGVESETETVDILLEKKDTKIGGIINKPVDYWYEVELNPFTNPQTLVCYDEEGAKTFKLYPEGADVEDEPIEPEDIPIVDEELDLTSTRPVQNQAISRAITQLKDDTVRRISSIVDELDGRIESGTAESFNKALDEFKNRVNGIIEEGIEELGDEIYTIHNKPTAEDVGAVPNTGGTIKGVLDFDNGLLGNIIRSYSDKNGLYLIAGAKKSVVDSGDASWIALLPDGSWTIGNNKWALNGQPYGSLTIMDSEGNTVDLLQDTGWIDIPLSDGLSYGKEMGYLKGRCKDGVLYIRGDIKGVTANWQQIGSLPTELQIIDTLQRFAGVYDMIDFCGFLIQPDGKLFVSSNGTGNWNSTYTISINTAVCE